MLQMPIDLINISRRIRASSPSLQLLKRSLTLLPLASSNLKDVDHSDAGGGSSLRMALLALVGGLRSLRL